MQTLQQQGNRRARDRCDPAYSDRALDPQSEPPLGAHLVTPRRWYTHHGIYVGKGRVVQYSGLSRRLCGGPIEEVSQSRFSQGRAILIRRERDAGLDPAEVVRRARLRLGENRYRLFTNNCEHFCEWCIRGEHRSYQVDELSSRCILVWRRLISMVRLARAVLGLGQAITPWSAAHAISGERR